MVYRVAICDDSAQDVLLLRSLTEAWAEERSARVVIRAFESAEAFLFSLEEEPDWDVLLLDVEMGGMNGVELARRLRAKGSRLEIVFVTGYSDYIAEGYDVSALHYLMKPVDRAKFFAVLDRARTRLLRAERTLMLPGTGEVVRVPLPDIVWIEVRGNYVTLHADREYTVKATLSAVEKQLDESFFRVGRSFIVQLGCVRRVSRTQAELSDGAVIPLPRGAYEALNRAIISLK